MFISNTETEKKEMLRAIGAEKFEDLIKQVPGKFLGSRFDLPEGLSEMETYNRMKELSLKNRNLKSFVGGGAYERYIPSAVKALISRGEFLTAYTPYQPEASQGILQTIYEYQSSMCALYEMDCSNASMYDGSTAFAEAVKACVRINSRKKILYASTMNPRYLDVAKTYFSNPEYEFTAVPAENGAINPEKLKAMLDESVSCVAVANPNYFGVIEDVEALAKAAHEKGALAVCVADPLSLAVLKTPGAAGFDFAVGEGQSLGLPLSYGGPYLGIFTCKKEYVRQMPGRICGMTKDKDGKRGFVLTLQAREQHIRRDKAASNICSNQALCALSAAIYCAIMGPEGLRETALLNNHLANFAAEELAKIKGVKLKYGRPFFNEFVLELPVKAAELREKTACKEGVDPGLDLAHLGKGFENSLLVCLTETKNETDVLNLKKAVEANLAVEAKI
ncbi:MAG: aminomethyl-transferring glycine dehydrogenase [Elusimicrobia bacterium CG08_land_8_20_14_0_20_51_18]|nr:MAG: aminomethyl-transferring glycine dehydrogenase [Elusimicrobia bacterium CG08_land_8_20_14_0_20_51_18]